MTVHLTAIIPNRSAAVEREIVAAMKHNPVAVAGGRATARTLNFNLRSRKDAVAARMRVYLRAKALGLVVGDDLSIKITTK